MFANRPLHSEAISAKSKNGVVSRTQKRTLLDGKRVVSTGRFDYPQMSYKNGARILVNQRFAEFMIRNIVPPVLFGHKKVYPNLVSTCMCSETV